MFGPVEPLRQIIEQRLPLLDESKARAELVGGRLEAAADCRCPHFNRP
jgi:hypothetical protein